ncbi:hypothetical protein MKW98_017304 [Papaver atlanticum]|uniref:Amino acid transporter transmembrane domain-containing protein n=1 Tax=Papaver atlanticum TaxID=357466 RepID=A0AAD4SS91_9MAGN|nr:hypothetical protein MKW98_017304 [Papaver atlanticum]
MNMNSAMISSSFTTPLVINIDSYRHRSHEEQIITINTKQTDEESVVLDNTSKETIGTSTFFKTCFNGINALSGVGILSLPYALASGGWLTLILLFIVAAATYYTGLLMRRCMDHAFGKKGKMIVSSFMYLELYVVATGFLILEGDNLSNLFPNMSFTLAGVTVYGQQGFVMLVALIILPSMWLTDLSKISYVSATGILASALIILSVFWVGAEDTGFRAKGRFFHLNGIPTGVGLYTFCYCAHPVFPTLYTSMKDKRQFSKVLLLCFVLCTISYAAMAVLGYLMFGENIKSQVTLNLPTDKLSSKIAIYTTLVTPIAKYALMATPIVSAIESSSGINHNNRVSSVTVALAIPFFGYLMSLVGAFLSATASIIIPCLCYLKIMGTYRRWGCELVIIIGIILMGISVVVIGTYTSLEQIASEFNLSF